MLAVLALLAVGKAPVDPRKVMAITHVTIIDVTGAPPQSDMTVLISGERIVAISETEALPLAPDAEIVDGTDKFLIPGLWDMHVHALQKERIEKFFPQFVANGVLGIRDMGGPAEEIESIVRWRQQEADGELLGPRIVAAGAILDGPEPMFPSYSLAVPGMREGHSIVIDLKQRGWGDSTALLFAVSCPIEGRGHFQSY